MQFTSACVGAVSAAFTIPLSLLAFVNYKRMRWPQNDFPKFDDCLRKARLAMIPAIALTVYHSRVGQFWPFALGGQFVLTVPSSLLYLFVFCYYAGNKELPNLSEFNQIWRQGVLVCSIVFWPLLALHAAVSLF